MGLRLRVSKYIVTIFALLVFAGLILLALLVSFRTDLATWALRKALVDLPLEHTEFRVVELGLRSFEMEITQMSATGWKIEEGRISATYAPSTLWKDQAIDQLEFSGINAMLDIDAMQAWSSESEKTPESTDSLDLDAAFQSISDLLLGSRVPIAQVSVDGCSLQIVTGTHAETVSLSADIKTVAQILDSASFNLTAASGHGQFLFSVLADKQVQLELNGQFDAPIHSLDQWYPDWRSSLNLGADDALSIVSIEVLASAKGKLEEVASISGDAKVKVSGITGVIAGDQSQVPEINFHLKSSSIDQPALLSLSVLSERIEHQLSGHEIQLKDLELELTTLRERPFERVDVSLQSTVDVHSEANGLHVRSALSVTAGGLIDSLVESLSFEVRLDPTLVEMNEHRIVPSQIVVSGNAREANLLIEALGLDVSDTPYLTDTRLAVAWLEDFSPSAARLHTTIAAQSEWPVAPLLRTSELQLEAELKLLPSDAIELKALVANALGREKFTLAYADQLHLEGIPEIRLDASAQVDLSSWQLQLGMDLNDGQLQAAEAKLAGLVVAFAAKADQSLQLPTRIDSGTGFDYKALHGLLNDLELGLTWEADSLIWEVYELGWPAGEIALNDGNFLLSVEGSQLKTAVPVTPRRIDFEFTAPFENWPKTAAQLHFEAQIDGSPLELSADLSGDFSDFETPWDFDVQWAPFELEYSDVVSRLIPAAEGLSVTGKVSGEVHGSASSSSWDGRLSTQLTGGSVDLPASQIKADGIEGQLVIDSLYAFTSEQSSSNRIDVEQIEVGGVVVSDTRFSWSWLSSNSIYVNTVKTSLFGGSLELSPSTVTLSPFDVASRIRVTELSLYELEQFFDLFDGTMEGVIEGLIPFTFRDNTFLPQSTKLRLPKETEAKLHYTSEALKQSLATDSPYLLKSLKLEPSTLITDALADLTITEFRVNLFPQDSPGTPLKINMAGHGMSGKTLVPLVLDIPIKGSLEELYILLLRVHSRARTQ